MAQENIKITLPVSKVECEIKPYITHKVSRKISSSLIGDTELDMQEISKGNTDINIKLTGDKALKFNEILVEGMTLKIGEYTKKDGTLTQDVLDELAEEDYSAITKEATRVYNESQEKTDPKDSLAGKTNTTEG